MDADLHFLLAALVAGFAASLLLTLLVTWMSAR